RRRHTRYWRDWSSDVCSSDLTIQIREIPRMERSLRTLETEKVNPATSEIDLMSPLEIVQAINAEDATVAQAVEQVLPQIAAAIEVIAERLRHGGRLIYAGAGTSGRLGALDASECPPTFNLSPDTIMA